MRTLVLGGARSGKSSFAERLASSSDAVDYVATSPRRPDDPEWDARIAAHVARRPASWRTVETLDVAGVLAEPGEATVLVDCLTLWLSAVMDRFGCWFEMPEAGVEATAAEAGLRPVPGAAPPLDLLQAETDALAAALRVTSRDVICVSNEVGQGIVPATASGRLFRDRMGVLNATVAAACDEVWFLTAGLPQRLKG